MGNIGPQNPGGLSFDPGTPIGAILKRTGDSTLGEVTAIPESLIVSNHAITSFTNDVNSFEIGSTVNTINLAWTLNRNSDNPTSQSISPTVGTVAVALRAAQITGAGVTTSTTYTYSGIGDDGSVLAATTSVTRYNRRYWGYSTNGALTAAQILALVGTDFSQEFITGKTVSKVFTVPGVGSKYMYYVYPLSFGAPTTMTLGGFAFVPTTYTIVSFTNASGYSEDFIAVRTNQVYVPGTVQEMSITS